MKKFVLLLAASTVMAGAPSAWAEFGPGEARFRDIYKELVETNTSLSVGSCTLAAERMAARLRTAGLPQADVHLYAAPDHPQEGGLVAVLPGSDPTAKAILLLAHIDVVEAKREDWSRDPFTLVEENGNFYARGAVDDKSEAAIWVDTLVRLKEAKQPLRRTIKMALTCGEETNGAFNGAHWLAQNQRALIDAEFALNEGAWGELDAAGHKVLMQVQAGEKSPVNFRLEVTNRGGHSSRPVKDNAIYHLAAALTRISQYDFPAQFADGNRAYFAAMAKLQAAKGETEVAKAMTAFVKDPSDVKSIALVAARDPSWNGTLRTTCVATLLDAGHASNALPQRARANVNCRIFPGVSAESVRGTLVGLVADPAVTVTNLDVNEHGAAPPPLTPAILEPLQKLTQAYWPGVPVVPILQAGATDGRFLIAAGIPTYGLSGTFAGPDLGNIHGLNEYIGVDSLLQGREFLYRLVRLYGNGK